MPSLFKFLEHANSEVRSIAIILLGKLANYGEFSPDTVVTWLTHRYGGELHEEIKSITPLLIKRLADGDSNVQLATVSVLDGLLKSGEPTSIYPCHLAKLIRTYS